MFGRNTRPTDDLAAAAVRRFGVREESVPRELGTARTLGELVGRLALLPHDGLAFRVNVTDARLCYGKVQALVTPESGFGSRWVDAARLRFTDGEGR